MKIVLLAGGRGTRLWPVSTKDKPKQYHSFGMSSSLLRETFLRVSDFGVENIVVVTLEEQKHLVARDLPELKDEQVITLPYPHDSAMGIAFAIQGLEKLISSETEGLIFLPSDHLIAPNSVFCSFLKNLEKISQQNPEYLITVGISPTDPATRYGYIHCDNNAHEISSGIPVFKVKKFLEKPDKKKAEELIATKHVLWNAGFIIGSYERLKKAYLDHAPEFLEATTSLDKFRKTKALSFDYAIWEKEAQILCVPSNHLFSWNDVGMWDAIPTLSNNQKISSFDSKGNKISFAKTGNIAYSESKKDIVLLGMEDTVVIEGENGILVSKKDNLSSVKSALKELNLE